MEKSNSPHIRFKGFTEPWEQRKVIELGKVETGNTPSTSIKDYYSEDGLNWVTPTDITSNITLTTEKKLSKKGEQVGRVIPANSILCTCIASIGKNTFSPVKCAFNQQINALIPSKDNDPYFLFVASYNWSQSMLKGAGGLTFQIVNKTEFSNIETWIPSNSEQKKIGSLFYKLDNLITLHQRKCERLKKVKQGLLEKMFPAEKEDTPQIRFKGFTEPWEQRKLSDVGLLRGRIGFRGYTQLDLVSPHEGAITFSPSDINDEGLVSLEDNDYISFYKYEESPEIKVGIGDILFTKTASIGKIGFIRDLQEKATINPQFALITPRQNIDNYFLFLSLRLTSFMTQAFNITGGSSIPTMPQEKLKLLRVFVPCTNEQSKISNLLYSLDNLITLHQRKHFLTKGR